MTPGTTTRTTPTTGTAAVEVSVCGPADEGALSRCTGKGASNRRNQRGMVSAEWAVGIIAAVAVAGVLLGIVTSGPVHDALLNFILMVIRSFAGFVK
jgi:Protein of unknown function (DUF4244)